MVEPIERKRPVFSASPRLVLLLAVIALWIGFTSFHVVEQNEQVRLQPAVPKESTGVPGRKWERGFFSMGSTQ